MNGILLLIGGLINDFNETSELFFTVNLLISPRSRSRNLSSFVKCKRSNFDPMPQKSSIG